jgi:hypothetical protein
MLSDDGLKTLHFKAIMLHQLKYTLLKADSHFIENYLGKILTMSLHQK